ncbi:hypothetical protein M6B38_148840 [Iris pallida]|uniref:Uncharacterized protein n=1 Tax=Iris pallida TaxID=29817 RepID=A0AAX6F8Q6_IRIPA|nr:hypothetical protein M6B38_148840 [Iris pallida]
MEIELFKFFSSNSRPRNPNPNFFQFRLWRQLPPPGGWVFSLATSTADIDEEPYGSHHFVMLGGNTSSATTAKSFPVDGYRRSRKFRWLSLDPRRHNHQQ